MKVPFGTLTITESARQRISEALDSGRLTQGRYVQELEERFALLAGTRHAVAMSSGADALTLALAALHDRGAKPGDHVIVPALSFAATGNAVLAARLTPVFVDVSRDTLNIDPEKIEEAVTARTRAIVAVHLMGKPAEMDRINEIARRRDLWVIEDSAEAHGAFYRGRPAGSLGSMAAFSLYAAHAISCVEGGMVTTDDPQLAEILRSLRAHGRACACETCALSSEGTPCPKRFDRKTGRDIRFHFPRIGYSSKMNELEAAVGLGCLDIYADISALRRANLLRLMGGFSRFAPLLRTIREQSWEIIGPHAFPIMISENAPFTREDFTRHLEENGIETRTLFDSMPTRCPGFAFLGHKYGDFPEAEYLGRMGLHIGVHQDLDLRHTDHVLSVIAGFLEAGPGRPKLQQMP